jgi:hypothetical protein
MEMRFDMEKVLWPKVIGHVSRLANNGKWERGEIYIEELSDGLYNWFDEWGNIGEKYEGYERCYEVVCNKIRESRERMKGV